MHALTGRVKKAYEELRGYQAERIARTEALKASNRATEMAYRQSGVVKGKGWLSAPGCCPFCAEMDGRVMGLGQNFFEKGDSFEVGGGVKKLDYEDIVTPPLHPNCRCTLVAIL